MPQWVRLSVYRGDSEHWTFTLFEDPAQTIPYDLAGVTVKAQIRTGAGALLAELVCAVTLPNVIDVALAAAVSAGLCPGTWSWDLQLTYPDGAVKTVVAGPVAVTGDVTDSVPA